MALQTSGAISFANLQTEFGGSHPITMGEYSSHRVSGSGNTISMNQFYGAAALTSSVEVQPAAKYQLISGPRNSSNEAILHGFGQTYTNTYSGNVGSYNSPISSSIKTDSAQGSIVSSPDLSVWGPSSGAIGTLRSITHFSRGASQALDAVMMIVESTGSNSNSGFTNLVATRSGMTTLTLARSNAVYFYSSTNTTRIWLWDNLDYSTGTPTSSTATHDSSLFPGGSGSGSANTTTTDRSTWTVS